MKSGSDVVAPTAYAEVTLNLLFVELRVYTPVDVFNVAVPDPVNKVAAYVKVES